MIWPKVASSCCIRLESGCHASCRRTTHAQITRTSEHRLFRFQRGLPPLCRRWRQRELCGGRPQHGTWRRDRGGDIGHSCRPGAGAAGAAEARVGEADIDQRAAGSGQDVGEGATGDRIPGVACAVDSQANLFPFDSQCCCCDRANPSEAGGSTARTLRPYRSVFTTHAVPRKQACVQRGCVHPQSKCAPCFKRSQRSFDDPCADVRASTYILGRHVRPGAVTLRLYGLLQAAVADCAPPHTKQTSIYALGLFEMVLRKDALTQRSRMHACKKTRAVPELYAHAASPVYLVRYIVGQVGVHAALHHVLRRRHNSCLTLACLRQLQRAHTSAARASRRQ